MISDFGLSKMLEDDDSDQLGTACGTPGYVGKFPLSSFPACQTIVLELWALVTSFFYVGRSSGGATKKAVWEGSGCVVNWCDCIHPVSALCNNSSVINVIMTSHSFPDYLPQIVWISPILP